MKRKIAKEWEQIVRECSVAVRRLDDTTLSEEEMEDVRNTAALAVQRMTGYGYEMAHDLDTIQNHLFQKWWFKLFTRLRL